MKIVQIGWVKNGSSTLYKALMELGFIPSPIDDANGDEAYEKLDKYNFDDGDYFFVQWPWCQWMTAKKLYNRWDDVYFIYLKRDFEKQHDSRSRDFEINSWSDSDGEWDVPKFKEMKDKVIEQWKIEEGIIELFLNGLPSDRWLKINICDDGDGWEKICPFLNVPIPDIPFPHLNKGGRG